MNEITINITNKRKFSKIKDLDFNLSPVYLDEFYRRFCFFRGNIEIMTDKGIKKEFGEFKSDSYEKKYGFVIKVK